MFENKLQIIHFIETKFYLNYDIVLIFKDACKFHHRSITENHFEWKELRIISKFKSAEFTIA